VKIDSAYFLMPLNEEHTCTACENTVWSISQEVTGK